LQQLELRSDLSKGVAADTVVCSCCSESVLRTAYSVHLPLCTGPAHDTSAHADNDNDDAMSAAASEVGTTTVICYTLFVLRCQNSLRLQDYNVHCNDV
jgi:hypothetical protein